MQQESWSEFPEREERAPSSQSCWFVHICLALGLCGLLSACGHDAGKPEDGITTLAGVTVRIACPTGQATEIIRRYSQDWAQENAAKIEILPYESTADSETIADVLIVPAAEMPHWAAQGRLLPVPEFLTANGSTYAWDDLISVYKDKLLVWDQKIYALPLLGDALLCYCRDDLLADPALRAAYQKRFGGELAPPATWQEFARIAEFFHNRPRPGLTKPCASLPPLPELNDDLDREFHALAVPFVHRAIPSSERARRPDNEVFALHYDLKSGEPRIAGKGWVEALTLMQSLASFRTPGFATSPALAFQKGEAVLCLAAPSWARAFQETGALRGKFKIYRTPGSELVYAGESGQEKQKVVGGNYVPYLGAGGWVMSVLRRSNQPAAAFALLAFLSDRKVSREVVTEPAWGGGAFRSSHLQSSYGWQSFGLVPNQTEELLVALRQTVMPPLLKNPVVRLRTPDQREHEQALLAEVRAALTGHKTATKALADAATAWEKLDSKTDRASRLANYRLSLSLSPKAGR